MISSNYKEKAIDEIVKIIQDFQYNDELSEKYKREILDQNKMYDWQSIQNKGQLTIFFSGIIIFASNRKQIKIKK